MLDHVVPPFALISCFLVLLPLPWHFRTKNVGTIALAIWLFLGNLDIFVNSVVWWSNSENVAPGWCEISIRLRYAMTIAIPVCNLAIAIRLEGIASTRQIKATLKDRRKQLWLELFLTLGVPFLYTALMIVNQSYRYNIIEEIGCWPAMWLSWLWVLLYAVPVLLVSVIAFVYSALAFRWFWIRRRQFQTVLASSASPYNQSRYVRMLALTAIDMLVFFPTCFGALLRQTRAYPLASYSSWASVHFAFNKVYSISGEEMSQSSDALASLLLSRWLCPVSSIIFFAMFGLSQEARQGYLQLFGIRKLFQRSGSQDRSALQHNVTADIEVVTLHDHDSKHSNDFDMSPCPAKLGSSSQKF